MLDKDKVEPISMFDGHFCELCQRRFDNSNNPKGYTRCPRCGERAIWSIEEERYMTTREIELRDFRAGRGAELERVRRRRKA